MEKLTITIELNNDSKENIKALMEVTNDSKQQIVENIVNRYLKDDISTLISKYKHKINPITFK